MKEFDQCATTNVVVTLPFINKVLGFDPSLYHMHKVTATINYYTKSSQTDGRDVDIQCVGIRCFDDKDQEMELIPTLWQDIDLELKDVIYQNFSFETLKSLLTIDLTEEHTLYKDMDRWPKSPLQNLSLALQQLGFSDDSILSIEKGNIDAEIKAFIEKNSLLTERTLG